MSGREGRGAESIGWPNVLLAALVGMVSGALIVVVFRGLVPDLEDR